MDRMRRGASFCSSGFRRIGSKTSNSSQKARTNSITTSKHIKDSSQFASSPQTVRHARSAWWQGEAKRLNHVLLEPPAETLNHR